MKIAYVTSIGVSAKGGAPEHILGLSSALAKIGHDVRLVTGDTLDNADHLSGVLSNLPSGLSSFLSATRGARIAARRALVLVAQEKPDIVYLRTFPIDYLLLSRCLVRTGVPYVCELNGVTDLEYAAKGRVLRGILYRSFEGRTLAHAAGWFPVTDEIYRYARRASRVERPFIIAKNGLDIERVVPKRTRVAVRSNLGVADSTPVLVMYGFERPWHGADRAISMLASLKRPAELWLIGSSSSRNRRIVEQVAERKGVRPLIRIFPWMDQEDAAELVSAADVGLGSLALDRNGMTEAQPLKVASYLALGISVLMNHKDPRINTELSFVRYVQSNDPKVLGERLESLLRQPPNAHELARRFASEQLSWRAVALETAEFLESLLSQQGKVAHGGGL